MMESKYRVEENAFFDWYTGYLKELSKSRRFNPERELRLSSWEYADLYFAKAIRLSSSPKPILIADLQPQDFPQSRDYSVSVLHGYVGARAMAGQTPNLTGELFTLQIRPFGELIEATIRVENDGLASLFSEIAEAMAHHFPGCQMQEREYLIINGTPAQVVGYAQNVVLKSYIRTRKFGLQDHSIKFSLGISFPPIIQFIGDYHSRPSNNREVTALLLPGHTPKTRLVIEPNRGRGDWEEVQPIWEDLLQELKRMGFIDSPTPPDEVVPSFPASGGQSTTQEPKHDQQIATTAAHYGITVKKISPQESAAKPMGTTDKTYRKYLKNDWLLSEDEFQKKMNMSIANYWEKKRGEK